MGIAVQAVAFFQIIAPFIVQLLKRTKEMSIPADHTILFLLFPLCQQVGNTYRRFAFIDKIIVQSQITAFG